MRKLPVYFLTIVFVYGVLGYIPAYLLMRSVIRAGMSAKINSDREKDKEDAQMMEFTREAYDQLEWEHAREFRYEGQMYDVIRIEKSEGLYRILCYCDKKESRLRDHFRQQQQQNTDGRGQGPAKLLKFFTSYTMPPVTRLWPLWGQLSKLRSMYLASHPDCIQEVPSPPPRSAADLLYNRMLRS